MVQIFQDDRKGLLLIWIDTRGLASDKVINVGNALDADALHSGAAIDFNSKAWRNVPAMQSALQAAE